MKSSSLQRLRNLVAQKSPRISQPATSNEVSEVEDEKYRQDGNSITNNSADAIISNDNTYGSGYSKCSLIGTNYADAVANLKLAVSLNIYGRKFCYPDYHTKGLTVCDALVDTACTWFTGYCIEPYPDVCMCGQVFLAGSFGILRKHCPVCKGNHRAEKLCPYFVQRLAEHMQIHQSWVEYAAAWALAGGYRNE